MEGESLWMAVESDGAALAQVPRDSGWGGRTVRAAGRSPARIAETARAYSHSHMSAAEGCGPSNSETSQRDLRCAAPGPTLMCPPRGGRRQPARRPGAPLGEAHPAGRRRCAAGGRRERGGVWDGGRGGGGAGAGGHRITASGLGLSSISSVSSGSA
jgi:hypothetical protein